MRENSIGSAAPNGDGSALRNGTSWFDILLEDSIHELWIGIKFVASGVEDDFGTKALGFEDLWPNLLVLGVFFLAYLLAAKAILNKQEK